MLNLHSSIWFDESYSAYLTRGDFADIWNLTAQDVHPPFFYFLLKVWSFIFGYTDISMRFMSIFFGALTIIFLFQLLKRWFGGKIASISTFFLCLSPMFIRYGQEMRMYTLVFLIIVLATYALDLALETKKTRYFVFYAILISLGMWTHYFTAIAWIAHIIYYTVTKRAKFFSKRMFLTYLLAVGLYLPWLPFMLHQVAVVQAGFWIPSVSIVTPVELLTDSLIYSDAEYVTNWLVVLILCVVIFTTILLRRCWKNMAEKDKKHFLLIAMLVVVPPALLIILSMPPLSSLFVDRYIIYSTCLLWVIIGLSVAFNIEMLQKQKHRLLTIISIIAVVISMIICAITGLVNVTNRTPNGFIADVIPAVEILSSSNEPILMDNEWNYYDAVFYSTDEHPIYGIDEKINYQYGSIEPIRRIGYNLIYDIDEFTDEHPRFWYVMGTGDYIEKAEKTDEDGDLQSRTPFNSDEYRIVSELIQDRFIAIELEKTTD